MLWKWHKSGGTGRGHVEVKEVFLSTEMGFLSGFSIFTFNCLSVFFHSKIGIFWFSGFGLYLLLLHGLHVFRLALSVVFHDHHGSVDFAHGQVCGCWKNDKLPCKIRPQWDVTLSHGGNGSGGQETDSQITDTKNFIIMNFFVCNTSNRVSSVSYQL